MVGRRYIFYLLFTLRAFQVEKNLTANAGDAKVWIQFLGLEDPLDKGMAIHSSILAWKISWTEERSGMESQESDKTEHTPTHCTPISSIMNSRIFVLTCLPLRLYNLFFSSVFLGETGVGGR